MRNIRIDKCRAIAWQKSICTLWSDDQLHLSHPWRTMMNPTSGIKRTTSNNTFNQSYLQKRLYILRINCDSEEKRSSMWSGAENGLDLRTMSIHFVAQRTAERRRPCNSVIHFTASYSLFRQPSSESSNVYHFRFLQTGRFKSNWTVSESNGYFSFSLSLFKSKLDIFQTKLDTLSSKFGRFEITLNLFQIETSASTLHKRLFEKLE